MTLNEIAEEIHRDLGAPTAPTQGLVKFWLRENIGALNNLLATDYSLDLSTYEITPELGENEKAIYKKMYMMHHYDWIIKTNTGAASFDAVLEVSSDGATVRRVNKNTVVQTFLNAKKINFDELKQLINGYKSPGNILPKQVTGDDTVENTSY